MEIIKKIEEMQRISTNLRKEDKIIGFVPTMGYLHEGHLSLVRLARSRADKVVVSIFVNPLQFGPSEDFKVYPRDLERDLTLLEKEGVDIVFVPSAEDMYPSDFKTYVEVTDLTDRLCGAFRPGHFKGVTTIVLKLFNIVKPHLAVFGEKDYQQLKVIQQMVRDLNLEIEILSHPTVREEDGLAMSSRNTYLSEEERRSALSLYHSLKLAERLILGGEKNPEKVRELVKDYIEKFPHNRVQYVEIADPETLKPVSVIERSVLIAIAVFVGKTRLIDNRVIKI
ncbi:pantoate--beta-alanine ligase [Caldimicrobium thiodismutans]|uniref:Pantothenate synthetase n=1 Tax=Caldimicrobium thiodismutans TaxID=1653476 RepID=A0A0U5AH96_9BACT|nr:pantoate--beta-alanine ligase [Caldimicrobium thiodismutans]BAU23315.1 pantoate--beta-alanine ligase [Caldimicrobium thiodismutans]